MSVPKYCLKYNHIKSCIWSVQQSIGDWITKFEDAQTKLKINSSSNTKDLEFQEIQPQFIFSLYHDKSSNSVDQEFWQTCLDNWENYKEWKSTSDWEDFQEYQIFQDSHVVKFNVLFHRGMTKEYYLQKIHHEKHFKYKSPNNIIKPCHLKLIVENREKLDQVPFILRPNKVIIGHRKVFYYTSENYHLLLPLWKFVFYKSWEAPSRLEAERKQLTEPPTYHVKLYCLEPQLHFCSSRHDTFYMACSALLKMQDCLTEQKVADNDFFWDPDY